VTVELNIEQKIVEHLHQSIGNIRIEAYNGDLVGTIEKALQNGIGLITVSHSNESIDYRYYSENLTKGIINEKYVVTILVCDLKSRETLYEFVNNVRESLMSFSYGRQIAKVLSHTISPQKFPEDVKNGLYIGDVALEVKVPFPINNEFIGA